MNNIKNFIFDLDGTLVNSSDEVLNCIKKSFEQSGYNIDYKRLVPEVIGPPLKNIIQEIAPDLTDETKINEIMLNFRQIYDYDDNDISVIYEGIYEFLCEIKISGRKLFIATFKPEIPTMRIVKKFGFDKLFDDIYTIDKFGGKITKEEMISDIISKYNLDKSQTVMIGDASTDMLAAKSAGIHGIGVLWGYGNNRTSLEENSDDTVKDIKELRACLK